MAMVVMATLEQRKCDRQQFAATNLMYTPVSPVHFVCSQHAEIWSHLSPQQLPHTDEDAPQPLVDRQSRAGERLPSELNNDDLKRRGNAQLKEGNGLCIESLMRLIAWCRRDPLKAHQ